MRTLRRALMGLVCALSIIAPSGSLNAGTDAAVLVLVNPKIAGVHGQIAFSLADLRSMEQRTIRTGNDFVDGIAEFRGPEAFALIDLIGRAGADRVRMTAWNDYSVEFGLEEIERYRPVLALSVNGRQLTMRDRGPVWLMFPVDEHDELQDPSFNNKMIWQLRTIELR